MQLLPRHQLMMMSLLADSHQKLSSSCHRPGVFLHQFHAMPACHCKVGWTGGGAYGRWQDEAAAGAPQGVHPSLSPSPPPHTRGLPADRATGPHWWHHGHQLLCAHRCTTPTFPCNSEVVDFQTVLYVQHADLLCILADKLVKDDTDRSFKIFYTC